MPRTIVINAAQLLQAPTTTWDPTTGTGVVTAVYTVGHLAPDGSFTQHINARLETAAAVAISATDTPGEMFSKLTAAIASQEGLDLGAGDQVLLP